MAAPTLAKLPTLVRQRKPAPDVKDAIRRRASELDKQRGRDGGQMGRRTDEADYVVENLCRARRAIIAHPEWFEPDAAERIDKAIASLQEVRLGVKAA